MPKETDIQGMHKFGAYKNALVNFIKLIDQSGEHEDILQDVFIRLIEHPAPETIKRMRQWLCTVARNVILDRKRKRKETSFSDILSKKDNERLDVMFFGDLWIEQSLPSDLIESTEFWNNLNRELAKLPREQREIFVAHELNGVSFKELSAQTGVSIKTLVSRKRYAVLQLRKKLEYLKR